MTTVTRSELLTQINELIPYLNENDIVDLFEQEMMEDGYLSNDRHDNDGLWQNARDWLKDYVSRDRWTENFLEQTLKDIQCKLDYPDS